MVKGGRRWIERKKLTEKELRFERSSETKSIELEGLIDRGLWVGAGGIVIYIRLAS